MDFSYDNDQQMLCDSVDRFLTDRYSLVQRARLLGDAAATRRLWEEMAELGWMGAAIPEAAGGFGQTSLEAMIILERFGRHLVTLPYLTGVVLCGRLLVDGTSGPRRDALVGELISGKRIFAIAAGAAHALHSAQDHAFVAARRSGAFVLNGRMPAVLGADMANSLIVAARTSGAIGEAAGMTLFLVDAGAAGIERRSFRMIDAQGAAEITLRDVELPASAVIGEVDEGVALFDAALDHAIAGVCGEALGAMDYLVTATPKFTQMRQQYGAPLSKFQVLQHRMADMYIQTETARSMTYLAWLALDGDAAERGRNVSAAKFQVGRSGKFVGYQAVQLHGGMGVSEELDIGHHYIRLTVIDQLFGGAAHHLRRFGALSNALAPAI
jgi:alkylation response protein AidB-like acyl-CoA dehydrogenase